MRDIKVTVELTGDEQDAEELLDLLRFIAEEIKVKRDQGEDEEND